MTTSRLDAVLNAYNPDAVDDISSDEISPIYIEENFVTTDHISLTVLPGHVRIAHLPLSHLRACNHEILQLLFYDELVGSTSYVHSSM